MNSGTLKTLGVAVVVLLGVWFLLNSSDEGSAVNELFLPDLKAAINDINEIGVRTGSESFTVMRDGERWVVAERDGYAADVGVLRETLIALADAKVLEAKTSNPEKYSILGVDDPSSPDSTAIELTVRGGDIDESIIVGKVAQSSYRYARPSDQEQSVMIDQNPEIPASAGGWLESEIMNVSADAIASIAIVHADGEEIRVARTDDGSGSFEVLNMPEGRELSYPTVANGIGGSLADLTLEDVRPKSDEEPATVAMFETLEGQSITVSTYVIDDEDWIGFDSSDEAISTLTEGWLFAIPEYKANLVQRRFEDILAPLEDSEE